MSSNSSSNNNNNTNNDIKIVYELPKKGGGEIVNRVIERLNTSFNKTINSSETTTSLSSSSKSRYLLTIQILQCTEGSRWGRICCSELGMGWVVLEIQWKLTDTTTSTTTTTLETLTEGSKKLRDSGAIGFVDVCQNDFGEVALLNEMTPRLANEIANESLKGIKKQQQHKLSTK